MATDGSVSPTQYKFPGAYVSFFGPGIEKINKTFRTTYKKTYGAQSATDPFGAPSFVAAEMLGVAIAKQCAASHGKKISRALVVRKLKKVKLPATMAPFAPTLKRLAGDSLSSTCDAIADLPDEVLAPVLWWLDRELFAIQGKGRWLEDPVAFKPDQVSAAFVELRRVILET